MDKNIRPLISIVIPIHDMKGGADFLWRSINALMEQTTQDFEIVITKQGKMAENTNAGIRKARGQFIKVLYLDDYLAHPNALEWMLEDIRGKDWLICGASDNPEPRWTDGMSEGINKLGSPSALMMRNDAPLLFDENMSWLLDCDYYQRMFAKYGEPVIMEGVHVTIGKHPGQMTHILSDEEKRKEVYYLNTKHG